MSKLLSERELSERISRGQLIENASETSIEGVKYDFRLGADVLLPGGGPIHADPSGEAQGRTLLVQPGSLAYVLTKERLVLPDDVKAELSPKRKMSHAGVLVLGGFCVDPGYKGRLLFALFNYSTAPFLLRPGKKLIAAQFYQLDPAETPPAHAQEPIEDFPDDIVRFMTTYEPVTVDGLNVKLEQLRTRIDNVASEVSSREEWFKRVQDLYDQHDRQIGLLTKSLSEESANRKETEAEFRNRLEEVNKDTVRTTLRTGLVYSLILAIIVGIIGGLVGWGLRNVLESGSKGRVVTGRDSVSAPRR